MPKYTYNDSEGSIPAVPGGDYILGVEKIYLKNKKNSMIQQICAELRVLPLNSDAQGPLLYEYFGFDANQQWAIDVFLKALKRQPSAKGAEIDINDEWLKSTVQNSLGWATLKTEEYEGVQKNRVARWITTVDAKHPDPYPIFYPDQAKQAPATKAAPPAAGSTDF